MKKIISISVFSAFCFLGLSSAEARDLTYKIGGGYSQVFTNTMVPKGAKEGMSEQLNALTASYGIAQDMQIGGLFGFQDNFDFFMAGPYFRYDIHRLISRDFAAWNHLNIFVQAGFFIKAGDEVETGITLQAPYAGFEILPFSNNNFAIQTAAGLVIDFMKDNAIGFTDGMFGDVGVKYYF